MTDKAIEVRATEIPGMRISYQGPVDADGRGLSFEIIADQTIAREDLDEVLDRVAEASRRQMAFDQLRISKEKLRASKLQLDMALKERARAYAILEGHVQKLSQVRRGQVQATAQDAKSVQQWDETIITARNEITLAEWRIPYWEAIRDRREPPELPEIQGAANDTQMAAE